MVSWLQRRQEIRSSKIEKEQQLAREERIQERQKKQQVEELMEKYKNPMIQAMEHLQQRIYKITDQDMLFNFEHRGKVI